MTSRPTGTSGITARADGVFADRCFARTSSGLLPTYGGLPVAISNITQPSEYASIRQSPAFALHTSGAVYTGPTGIPHARFAIAAPVSRIFTSSPLGPATR